MQQKKQIKQTGQVVAVPPQRVAPQVQGLGLQQKIKQKQQQQEIKLTPFYKFLYYLIMIILSLVCFGLVLFIMIFFSYTPVSITVTSVTTDSIYVQTSSSTIPKTDEPSLRLPNTYATKDWKAGNTRTIYMNPFTKKYSAIYPLIGYTFIKIVIALLIGMVFAYIFGRGVHYMFYGTEL
jgi:hypothetical protein